MKQILYEKGVYCTSFDQHHDMELLFKLKIMTKEDLCPTMISSLYVKRTYRILLVSHPFQHGLLLDNMLPNSKIGH
jgi:hypothetical protein